MKSVNEIVLDEFSHWSDGRSTLTLRPGPSAPTKCVGCGPNTGWPHWKSICFRRWNSAVRGHAGKMLDCCRSPFYHVTSWQSPCTMPIKCNETNRLIYLEASTKFRSILCIQYLTLLLYDFEYEMTSEFTANATHNGYWLTSNRMRQQSILCSVATLPMNCTKTK